MALYIQELLLFDCPNFSEKILHVSAGDIDSLSNLLVGLLSVVVFCNIFDLHLATIYQ